MKKVQWFTTLAITGALIAINPLNTFAADQDGAKAVDQENESSWRTAIERTFEHLNLEALLKRYGIQFNSPNKSEAMATSAKKPTVTIMKKPVTKQPVTSDTEKPETKQPAASDTEKPTTKQPAASNTEKSKAKQPATSNAEKPTTDEAKPTQDQQTSYRLNEFEQQVVDLTNKERAKYHLPALKIDIKLSQVARAKSQDMHDQHYFDHNSPTYGSPFEMMKKFGIQYRAAGENIAMGQRTPEEVVKGWMNSKGHRENILNEHFTHIGVGYVKDGNYWTQQFIGK